jgi:SAM-dependent methyltransferase
MRIDRDQPALLRGLNSLLLPLKLMIPQPIIKKIPGLTTNEDVRLRLVLSQVSGKLLDIGCGNNRLVETYRRAGGEGLGVDVHPWEGVDLVVADASRLPYADGSFDTVTMVACINHIANRDEVLREAHRLLAPSGRLVFTNLHPLPSRLWHAWAFWDQDQRQRGRKEGETWGFTHAQLIEILRRAGFEQVRRQRFSWGLNNLYVYKLSHSLYPKLGGKRIVN